MVPFGKMNVDANKVSTLAIVIGLPDTQESLLTDYIVSHT